MNAKVIKQSMAGLLSLMLVFSGTPTYGFASEFVDDTEDQTSSLVLPEEPSAEPLAIDLDVVTVEEPQADIQTVDPEVDDAAAQLATRINAWAEVTRASIPQDASQLQRAEAVWTALLPAAKQMLETPVAPYSRDDSAAALDAMDGVATTEQGLAHAFALMARELGLEALEVGVTSGIAWNMVRIDGTWYHVDLVLNAGERKAGQDEHAGLLASDATMMALEDQRSEWYVLDDPEAQVPEAVASWQWAETESLEVSDTDVPEIEVPEIATPVEPQVQEDDQVPSALDPTVEQGDDIEQDNLEGQDNLDQTDDTPQPTIANEGDDEQVQVDDEVEALGSNIPELPSDEELAIEALAYEAANTYVVNAMAEENANAAVMSVPYIQSGAPLDEVSVMAAKASALDAQVSALADLSGAKTAIGNGMKSYTASIDISAYKVTSSQVMTLMWEVVNENPELFYVTTQVGYRTSGAYVSTINPVYLYNQTSVSTMKAAFTDKLNSMVSWASKASTPQDKVKAMHDYLCRYTSYNYTAASASYNPKTNSDGYNPWTAYGALCRQNCVCQGYTLALRAGINKLKAQGVSVAGDYAMTSGHIWNTVKVGSNWYNVDVTSDDPGTSYSTTPYATFYLKSDTWFGYFQSNWDSNYKCSSTSYDSASWKAYPVATTKSITGASVTGIASKVYTGKAITQSPVVKVSGTTLKAGTDYTLSYTNNVKAGTATVKITGKGSYTGTISKTFTITKATNPLTVTAASKTASFTTLKSKALTVARPLNVSKNQGTVTYAKASGSTAFTVNKTTGKVTVKKGTKKGTYTIKIKVTAAGNANYKALSKTVATKIVVK